MRKTTLALLIIHNFYFALSAQRVYTLADTSIANQLLKDTKLLLEKSQLDSIDIKLDKAQMIFEQILGKETNEMAEVFNLKAWGLSMQQKLTESLENYEKSIIIRIKVKGSDKDLANTYTDMGIVYQNKGELEQSKTVCQKALDILLKSPYTISPELGHTYNVMGWIYFIKHDMDNALSFFQKSLAIHHQLFDSTHIKLAQCYQNIGNACIVKGELNNAHPYLQKALDIRVYNLGWNHSYVAQALNSLGILYENKGEYDRSIDYYKRALAIMGKTFGYDSPNVSILLNNIALVYGNKGDVIQSLQYHQRALDISQKVYGFYNLNVADNLHSVGVTYRELRKYDKALDCFEKAADITQKILGADSPNMAHVLTSMGACYYAINDYKKAIIYLQKGLGIKGNPSLAFALNTLGDIFNNKQDYIQALSYYEKALKVESDKMEQANMLTSIARMKMKLKNYIQADSLFAACLEVLNFKTIERLENTNSLFALTQVLPLKANFEREWFHETRDTQYLNSAIETYQKAISIIDLEKKSLLSEGSKSEFQYQIHAVYEGAIGANLLHTHLNGDNNFKKQAFDYSEQGKATLLQAQIKESNALKYSNIPSTLLEKEYNLRVDINWREKQRQNYMNEGKNENDSSVTAVSSILFDLHQQYDILIQQFEKNYPDYYRLKYDLKTVNIVDIQQKLLSKEQTILSYFVGDSSVFAFVIKQDTFAVSEIKKDFPLELWIKQLRYGLYGDHQMAMRSENLYGYKADSFAIAAVDLYNKLVAPISHLLTKELVIIPDGILGYIPFDVLLTEMPLNTTKFNTHKYLGRSHIISYNYSATLWKEMRNKKHKTEPKKQFIGFAPYYDGDTTLLSSLFSHDPTIRKGLKILRYSGEEVYIAQKLMNGESILNKQATKEMFEKISSSYRIVHLATHGNANDKIGDYCFLAFAEQKDSLDNELLYVRDIYNLSLNADLVVLSACETGIGELKRGEGIVSLSRAFAYAGAKSMVTTLWDVNDKSTKYIMEGFYRQLRKGQPKDKALWQAKIDYFTRAKDELAHPYFWSAFIPIGDMSPVKK